MNTLADSAVACHGDEVSSASITLQPALAAPRQARTFTRRSLYRWGEDEQLIEAAVLVVCEPVTNAVRHGVEPPSRGRRCERQRPSLITLDALAEYWPSGRTPGGGKWVRACMSRGNGLFDEGW